MAYNQLPGASYSNEHVGQLILGVRKDNNAVSQVSGTNIYHPLLFDTAGNLRVGVQYQAGGAGASVSVTTASNEITVNCTSSNSSIQVFGTVTATGVSVSMGPVGVTGGNINIVSANNIISVTSTGLFGVITTSSNSSIQVFGTVTATGVSVSMGPVGVTGGNINIVSANNIISVTSTGLFGVVTTSSNSSIQVFGTVTATGVSVSMGPVGVTGGNINIASANNIISVTSTGLLGVTQNGYWIVSSTGYNLISHTGYMIVSSVNNAVTLTTAANIITVSATNPSFVVSSASNLLHVTGGNFGVNLTTSSSLLTVSHTNAFIGINTASSQLSITSTGLIGITHTGYLIVSHTGYAIVSANNPSWLLRSAAAIQSITSTGLLGVTQTGYWLVSHSGYMIVSCANASINLRTSSSLLTVSATNPAVYSVTATSLDGTFVVMPYTTASGYFSTTCNFATSQSNKQIVAKGALTIYVTHIKASCITPTNYWLVEDSTGTPLDKWGVTYLGNYAGENATLTAPLKLTAAKDLGVRACCTNFTITVVGYAK